MDWVIRLGVAVALSGLIGFEREARQKAAGLRTHALVGLGATLFTLVGVSAFPGGDSSRVAAQVVTGVGFLGAGAIFRSGPSVHGLTTAAGLWAVAAIGVVVGVGELLIATVATVGAVIVLYGLSVVETYMRRRLEGDRFTATVTVRRDANIPGIVNVAHQIDDTVEHARVAVIDGDMTVLTFTIRESRLERLLAILPAIDGVVDAVQSDPSVQKDAAG